MSIAVLRLVGVGLGILVTVVIGRTLGPEGLGQYGYAIILLTLAAVPVGYGWNTLLLRQVSRSSHDGVWSEPRGMMIRGTQLAALLSLCVFTAGSLLQLLPGLPFPIFGGFGTWALLAAVLFFDQLSALRLAVLRGLDHPVWGQLPEMLLRPGVIALAFVSFAFLLGPAVQLQHAFWALLVAASVSAAAGAWVLRHKAPQALTQANPVFHTKPWLTSVGHLSSSSGLILLNSYADILMLGALGSLSEVGIYRVSGQVALFSGFAYTALNMLASQRFAYLKARDDLDGLQQTAVFMARIALLCSLPLPVIFYFFGGQLLESIFGASFLPALTPMFFLFFSQTLNAAVGMPRTLLIMNGDESKIPKFTVASLLINIVLGVFLIPRYGATGAALSTTISTGLWNIAVWLYAYKAIGLDSSVLGLERAKN